MSDSEFMECQRVFLEACQKYKKDFKEYMGRSHPILWIRNEESGECALITDEITLGDKMIQYSQRI